jgi:outer membrane protein OmpA-like peptidoglycan-associated protein
LTVDSEGEDNPFVPTADAVREIQNRRVDIRPE